LGESLTVRGRAFQRVRAARVKSCSLSWEEVMRGENTSLQNENQCLKKNISALLKTARVEITRKQDEIDHLNQSLLAGPRRHHTHAIPSLLRGVRSIIAQEIKMPRDARLNNSDIAARTEVNAHGGPRINIVEKEKVGCSSEVPKEKDHRRRKEEWQDISASSQSERETFDLRERLQNSSIRRKSEGSQKNTHFDMNYESSKKYCTLGSHDKLDTTGSKTLLRDDSGSQNMLKATCETSKHERETGVYRRDRSTDRRKSDEKDNLLRKTKLIPDLYAKDERSHKSSKGESTHRRNHDDNDRREKPSSAYSKDLKSLSRTSKELNLSLYHKDETSSSKNDRNDRESKSDKQDQEKRGGEKKRYREDRDKCNYERKEHKVQKEGEKLPSQSPNKRKSVNLCRSESLTERTDSRSTVDDGKKMLDEELNSPKDLKLSFMQTLNLTLSPAKKDTPSEEDTSMESIPDSKEKPNTGVSEVSLDSSFVLPKSMGSPGEIKTKQCLHNPADVPKPNLPKNLSGGPLQSNSSKENIVDLCLQDPDLFNNKPEDDRDNANISKSAIYEKSKGTCQSSNVAHIDLRKEDVPFMPDEGSTMSIDFNVLRHIPKVISPLTSPVKPLGKLHKVQSSATPAVVNVSKKEFSPDASSGKPSVLLRKELNKENCQPEVTSESARGNYSPVLLSSDELEEGEIRSDEEETFKEEKPQAISSPIQHCTAEHVKSPPTTVVLKKDVAPSNSPAERRISPKQSTINMKDKSKLKTKKKAASISNMSKNVNDISCLDGIVKIIPLSSIEDVLQMLQAIRMRMRSKYMKFKVQVSAQQFYNVIEYGSLRFRILVESLDWSVVCSSPESLKRSICKCVESKFKRIKKNGIVDRIFEQHLTDMKKKLWQFVDDQLDSLFDTLKTMLANLCDKAKPERDGSKSKLTVNATSNTEGPSAAHVKGTRHFGSKAACSSNKLFAPELLCSRQRPFEKKCDPNVSSSKQPCVPPTNKAVQIEVVKDVSLQFSSTPLNTGAPKPIQDCLTQSVSPKSDHSLKNTSGLSFDLVSDAHMGDIFKSLLNDADHVQNEDVQEENAWFCISPEKSSVEQKSEIVISPAEATTPVKTSPERLPPSWPLASPSPNRLCSYTTLLHPDILDESCMLEIPCSVSFKSFESLEDRSKSFHSILLEDLAVSLTVPSPLKSDSHLSFLRGSGVSQSAHDSAQLMISQNNEGVQLEEEDATEQDIHLTLDSENSSRCSSPVASEPPAFQYHPSEPMQAVIMEKSNDHFIVKIRRAVSSNSPASDRSTAECMGSGLSPLEDQDMRAFFEATGRNADTVLRTMEKDENDMLCQVKTCTDGNDLPKDISGKRDDESVTPQLLLNSSTPERKGSDLKSPKDSRPETFTPTDFGDSGSPLENSNKRTKALDVVPINLEPDPLSSRMLPNPTTAENSDTGFVRKRKKSLKAETEAKRQKVSSFITENEQMKSLHAENSEAAVLATDKTLSKHKKSASDRAIKRSTKCHQNNLSAKNVVKKKGEVVVSWTREEDRVILLECQKRGPKEKTFLSLAKSLKKYPYQRTQCCKARSSYGELRFAAPSTRVLAF
uniref:Caspase 8 associated protein 2 n=1 Tax=Leptobrachium leishanense TaxID=445787 RepID=A0A8C5QCH1_9ANUR